MLVMRLIVFIVFCTTMGHDSCLSPEGEGSSLPLHPNVINLHLFAQAVKFLWLDR